MTFDDAYDSRILGPAAGLVDCLWLHSKVKVKIHFPAKTHRIQNYFFNEICIKENFSHTRKESSTLRRSHLPPCSVSLLLLRLGSFFINSFESGKLPDTCKRANITPIFKKGTRTLPQNYRPVSLLSVISKIMEKLIRREMKSHLASKKLISHHQHGFMEKKLA
jgi:hypothetical protein